MSRDEWRRSFAGRGGARAAALALLALAVASAACEPKDRRPGLWLSGELVTEPVTDWSFTDSIFEIQVETRTWYHVPHSVTAVCAAVGRDLYVPSVYSPGGKFPDERRWHRNVAWDPLVRLRIGGKLYERRAVLVQDPVEWQEAFDAFARKSEFWKELAAKPESERPSLIFLRMDPAPEQI
jgi:hypothetical protein